MMNPHFLLVLTSLVFLSFGAQAAADQEEEEVVVVKRTNDVIEDSSEHNRMKKQAQVTATLTGVAHGGRTSSLGAGMFLNRNSLILLEASSEKYAINFDSLYWNTQVDGRSLGVHYKHFTGNSFYFRTGVDYRTVSYSDEYRGSLSNYSYKFKGNAFVANFTIGNQWQWENFTLGTDWVGATLPLSSNIESETTTGTPSSFDVASFESSKKSYLTGSSGILLRFYLGASF